MLPWDSWSECLFPMSSTFEMKLRPPLPYPLRTHTIPAGLSQTSNADRQPGLIWKLWRNLEIGGTAEVTWNHSLQTSSNSNWAKIQWEWTYREIRLGHKYWIDLADTRDRKSPVLQLSSSVPCGSSALISENKLRITESSNAWQKKPLKKVTIQSDRAFLASIFDPNASWCNAMQWYTSDNQCRNRCKNSRYAYSNSSLGFDFLLIKAKCRTQGIDSSLNHIQVNWNGKWPAAYAWKFGWGRAGHDCW